MNLTEEAWIRVFEKFKIIDALEKQSIFQISAKQLKEIGKREPRLMAKFDTKESLPSLFKENKLTINANTNGTYIIYRDENYQGFAELPDFKNITPDKFKSSFDFPLQTLSFNAKMSESNAIDYAHHSKLLSAFCKEKELKLTTRGRFRSDSFDFKLGEIGNINVNGVQIEVDAGYEGLDNFLIMEAKSSTRTSFNIRQVYYPFRHFKNKTKKLIRPVLLSFSNGIYYFTEFSLSDDYYSYKVLDTKAFEVVIGKVSEKTTIHDLLAQELYTPKDVPVPQADDLNKVIDLITFLFDNPSDKYAIAEHFEFDERQGDYYGNAGRYIGVIEKKGTIYSLTALGVELVSIVNREERNIRLIRALLATRLFNDLVKSFRGKEINDELIIERLKKENITGATPERRKSTIKSWLKWIESNIKDK